MNELYLLTLSIAGSATVVAVVLGLPLAWLLGRHRFPGRSIVQAVLLLPFVLPATLLGYFLVVLGRRGTVTPWLGRLLPTEFDWRMALAVATVGALAVFVRVAQPGLERVDPRLEQVARTLGRSELSVFWSVTLPLSAHCLLAGLALALCRAAGEFALTLLVVQTIPAATLRLNAAVPVSVLALALTLVALLLLGAGRLIRVED